MLTVTDVTFSYRSAVVLQDLSFHMQPGLFSVALGPNGSGKTTLLRLVTGERNDYEGDIQLFGRECRTYSDEERARLIATVPQNMDVHFPYTCLDLVLLGRTPYRSRFAPVSPEDLAIVEGAMRETDTLKFAGRMITELSGGERQLVFLAKALAQEPQLLLLDESFANMDMYQAIHCLDMLAEKVRKEKLSVLAILHDLNLASQYAEQAVLLKNGHIVHAGPAEEGLDPKWVEETFSVSAIKVGTRGLAVAAGRERLQR